MKCCVLFLSRLEDNSEAEFRRLFWWLVSLDLRVVFEVDFVEETEDDDLEEDDLMEEPFDQIISNLILHDLKAQIGSI